MWKRKKNVIYLVFCIICLVSLALVLARAIFFHGETDVKKYGEFKNYKGYSKLAIFPENLERSENAEYYYLSRDTLFDPTCEIFLKCTYNEENFQNEVTRLSSIPQIKHEEEHFNYPAYVTMYNFSSTYEYALILEDSKEIIYINTQGIYPYRVLGLYFDKEYLPDDFMEDIAYTGDSKDNFTIY